MISARTGKTFANLTATLTARARNMGEAKLREITLTRRTRGGGHWRDARALWPLFTKG